MSRWNTVQALFEETVSLDAAERSRVLSARAGGDPEVIRQVEALITADDTPLPSFDEGAGGILRRLHDDVPPEVLCGDSFGAYTIEEHLSSGGMAHVYRATRKSAGTQRRVALKVLRPGLDADVFLERFQKERETLAFLEHEHIVSFVDAGALPDGRPYLVMEYIDGEALTTYAKSVPVSARIALFIRILRTVQYAHQQLIVHRDLKPSNVLVTKDGVPKLLDFGVASVLDGDPVGGSDRGGQDAIGPGPLTPGYASPEQLRGDPITAASDLYSLGKLLHEMTYESGQSAAAKDLRGDLEAIVKKALAEDPIDRYGSADHFAEDLRRYLESEPVSACPPAWAYRASLFVRRNRWPIALGAAVVTALLVGWVGAGIERDDARQDASKGWGAHSQAKVAAHVFEQWMSKAIEDDPTLSAEAASHLEAALERDLGRLPESETMIRMAVASIYLGRGETAKATPHAERAFELAQTTIGVGRVERERAAELRRRVRVVPQEEP